MSKGALDSRSAALASIASFRIRRLWGTGGKCYPVSMTQVRATIAQQQKQIEALTAGLQKVSAQLEASKPAAQVVNNP